MEETLWGFPDLAERTRRGGALGSLAVAVGSGQDAVAGRLGQKC